ncbi:MAG TPA: ATP-grasp domain-containing protein [Candidatus Woesebacteria bacterium]|nr:ATP-grasp domain-containing protein [Candidatus Woesebacteria bacterium]
MTENIDHSVISQPLSERPLSVLSPEQRREIPITVLYGGNSSERPGSIKSSLTVANLLEQSGYAHVNRLDITTQTIRELSANMPYGVAFMTMHGGYGEDGTLQGLLEMLDIPYTGSGVAASAISADKVLFNRFIRGLGYNAANQIVARTTEELADIDMTFPKVLKPANSGCSYGIFFVRDKEELLQRAAFTQKFSDRMIVEDYIPGRELTIGLFEDPHSRQPHVLPITENVLVREILDYEAKIPGGEHLYNVIVPAELDPATQQQIEEMSADVFQKLNCKGYVRMDLRLTENGDTYFIENNTNPGMLSLDESDFPKMLQAGGVDPVEFVDLMVEASLLNYQEKHSNNSQVPSKNEMVQYLGLAG